MGMAGCACARRRRTVCSRRLHCRRHTRREPAESREPPPQPCADVSISVLCCCCQLLCSNTCLSSIAFKCCKSLTCINTWHADLAQSMLSLPVQMSVRCIRSASYSRMLSHQKRVLEYTIKENSSGKLCGSVSFTASYAATNGARHASYQLQQTCSQTH